MDQPDVAKRPNPELSRLKEFAFPEDWIESSINPDMTGIRK